MLLSMDEEENILRCAASLVNTKGKNVFLIDEVLHTSASPKENQNNRIRSFDSLKKILCSLSNIGSSERGFYVPYNWEQFG